MAEPLSKLPTAADVLPPSSGESPEPPGEEVSLELPPEVLEIPAMHGLLHGAPPAVYAEVADKSPEVQTVTKNKDALVEAGFGFYRSKDETLTVLYNGVYVSPDTLRKADEEGKLTEVAVPFSQLKSDYENAVSGNTVPGQSVSSATATGNPPSARSQSKVTTARLKNLQPGSPTSGPSPGAGRLINNILTPAI